MDDERNDIFLHIDKKRKDVPTSIVNGELLQHSKLTLINSHDLKWGGYNQVACELELLFTALHKNKYDYFHLMSGVDLPLHSQDYIHSFFERNNGFEFVGKNDDWANERIIRYRYQVYHFLQDQVGRNKNFLYYLNKAVAKAQIPFVHRQKKPMSGGSAWFSITYDFANYMYNQRKWIEKSFKYTLNGDEHMIHSVLVRSEFANKQYLPASGTYKQCLRYVDFVGEGDLAGSPKTLELSDAKEILGSNDYIFARKFSMSNKNRADAVEYIYSRLSRENADNASE